MIHLKARSVATLFALALLTVVGTGKGWAEDASTPAPNSVPREKVQERIAKWKQLKAEHPEEFARLVQERKVHLKEGLAELKEKNPEKYQEIKERMRRHHRERLERLRLGYAHHHREEMRERRVRIPERRFAGGRGPHRHRDER